MPFLPIFSFRRDPENGVRQIANPPPPESGHEATRHRVEKHL